MGLLIYGFETTIIGTHESMISCPSCESHQYAEMLITGRYFHFYWIPFCPADKTVTTFCTKCGLKRELAFSGNVINDFQDVKRKFKYPWFTYIGIGTFAFFVLLGILLITLG